MTKTIFSSSSSSPDDAEQLLKERKNILMAMMTKNRKDNRGKHVVEKASWDRQEETTTTTTKTTTLLMSQNKKESTSSRPTFVSSCDPDDELDFYSSNDREEDNNRTTIEKIAQKTTLIRESSSHQRSRRKAVVILSKDRCGTTLMEDLLQGINRATNYHVDNYNRKKAFVLRMKTLVNVMTEQCGGIPVTNTLNNNKHDTSGTTKNTTSITKEVIDDLMRQYTTWAKNAEADPDTTETIEVTPSWFHKLYTVFENRFLDPESLFQFIKAIPSKVDHSFLAFHLKLSEEDNLGGTYKLPSIAEFLDVILKVWNNAAHNSHSLPELVVLVQWRSRFIESYVSSRIGKQSGTFRRVATTEANAITVNRTDLQQYVQHWFEYFDEVREALHSRNVTYHVIEYNRDLLTLSNQVQTMKHIMEWLGIPKEYIIQGEHDDDDALEEVFDMGQKRPKQARVPVEKQVRNWADVQKWGFGDAAPSFVDGNFDLKQFDLI